MFLSVFSCSVMRLILTSICALMGLFSPTARAGGTVPVPVPLLTPDPVTGGEQERLETPYLHLPVYLHYRKPRVDKQHFSPAHVQSREPLPERVRQVLVPAPRRRLKPRVRPSGPVSVACSATEMRVRVHTANLGASGERVHVRLGTCDVSRSTEQSVVLQYELHECGTQRQIINKTVVYSNMLHYTPDAGGSGSEVFSVPVQCRFNRFHYSYKIGFVPSVERLKFFKPMKTKGGVTLTACDAQWNRLSPAEAFVIGQPMYFEAETLYVPEDERLFVHFCHVTTNGSGVSTPQVKIIDNYGCLIDSKSSSRSRFINSGRRNVIRFTIDAFTLQGKVQKYLFIHCEMSIRSVVPTETSKSCSYNRLERRWEELYGADSVCSCCDSSCVPEMPSLVRPLTSELGALVEQHPEGKSRKNPTQSTERIFTPEPEHGILTTEIQQETIVPERTLILEHEHRTVTPEGTPTLESKRAVSTPESEHGKISTPQSTPTPAGERGVLTPAGEDRKITLEGTPTPESEQRTMMPDSEYGIPTPEHKYGMLENMHGKVAPEAPPTPESEHRTPTPDHEHGTPMPDTDHEEITLYPHEAVSPGTLTPSVKQNTITPALKHTELHEPYRIFEEVFGLS
ncbi:hypothetical protein PHYPO_G00124440 [Pangasianodon hypophthalmus]|uniref:Zona pellucida sperm-binding protein 3 n=1 Tax=Pangasianodon hypophthalmus TaxID=310915 RepID=A0A5N5KR52_PANHP|nr:hypothetical protein PHYPO_G00124440 [Pangasianodon hypophthalmus]